MTPPAGEAPTRHMPPAPDNWADNWGARGAANTAPQPRIDTSPVNRPPAAYQAPNTYQAPPTSYQMPPQPPVWRPAQYPSPPPTATGGRSGSSWAIVLAVILALLLGTIIGGRVLFNRIRGNIHINPPQPTAPGTGTVSATDKQTFPLNPGATVTIKTLNGSIKIEGWDEPRAEVQIIKKGVNGSTAVTVRNDEKSLYLEAPSEMRGGQVSFEVKLPRNLGTIALNSLNGAITLNEVTGRISVETLNGSINLQDVTGLERATTTNGSIDAQLTGAAKDYPITLTTTNGGIKLTVDEGFNATLDASTVHGKIDVDDEFEGIKTEKRMPFGANASGNLGSGGPTVKATTTNGSIKISK